MSSLITEALLLCYGLCQVALYYIFVRFFPTILHSSLLLGFTGVVCHGDVCPRSEHACQDCGVHELPQV